MLNFDEIKRVKVTDVVARYNIRLRFKGDWANAPCPLPTHKAGDKGRNFTINLAQNYWRCWSESCNQNNNGKKGGDVINFVAVMENCREKDAAQKIAEWYGLNGNKKAQQIAGPPHEDNKTPHKEPLDNTSPSASGKGYVHEAGVWLDTTLSLQELEAFEDYKVRVKKALVSKIIESYKNGKAAH